MGPRHRNLQRWLVFHIQSPLMLIFAKLEICHCKVAWLQWKLLRIFLMIELWENSLFSSILLRNIILEAHFVFIFSLFTSFPMFVVFELYGNFIRTSCIIFVHFLVLFALLFTIDWNQSWYSKKKQNHSHNGLSI